MKKYYLLPAAALFCLSANAQAWHEGDIVWPESTAFATNVNSWKTNHKINDDDNFFISRVKPHIRFQNANTQVRKNLTWNVNDKRLCAWLPINIKTDGNSRNALPTGEFDSECFTMWSYVDHYGNWNTSLGAIPGGFTDAAHKNGVAVSSVAGIPFGTITSAWSSALNAMCNLDAEDAAKMMAYFGHDGLGYNSEFSGWYNGSRLQTFHENLMKKLTAQYAKSTPAYNLAENMWYDGTNDAGSITFDRGLGSHNIRTWGPLGQERTSLFFNYNWNNISRMQQSVDNAASASYGKGRNPLYLYCGFNMQGGEPRSGASWPMLPDYNLSIGLWGAHSENMFWQYRGERGSSLEAKQDTYQYRLENWFTGAAHNPVNDLVPVTTNSCSSSDVTFQGMSYFMSARSAMGWDLSTEPFYTFFNIGNGRYFNWKGERANNNEWYNIGVQDYLPTWRWWLTTEFLSTDVAKVAQNGVKAQFSWDDAYVGGSCLRINGSTDNEYLHLLKTAYALQAGDVITVRYKLTQGKAKVDFVFSVDGAESKIANRFNVCTADQMIDDGAWTTKTYTVANGDGLAGKTLAMVAMNFSEAANMDFLVGEFSIKRGQSPKPTAPDKPTVKILRNTYAGVDAKLIWSVPNNKPVDEVCYNIDVNNSLYKVYAQEEGQEPVLMGITTSWAAMSYSTPFKGDDKGEGRIRFGVAAVSLDTDTDSEIVWGDYAAAGDRTYSDAIETSKTTVTPGEEFTLKAVDSKREFQWAIVPNGVENAQPVAQSQGMTNTWTVNGINEIGTYDLVVTRPRAESEKTEKLKGDSVCTHSGYIVITDAARGRIPEINTLTANGKEADITVKPGEEIALAYTGREADGACSRGIAIAEEAFGVRLGDILANGTQSFSVCGWMKIDVFPAPVNFIDIVQKDGEWPRNNWGILWSSLNTDGTLQNYDQDFSQYDAGATTRVLRYDFGNGKTKVFNKGQWTHFAMIFDRTATTFRTLFYINGKQVESTWQFLGMSDYGSGEYVIQSGTTNEYATASKNINLANYIIVGGTRHTGRGHGGSGFTGALDEFQVWDKAMTADEVKASMEGLDPNNLPDGLAGYWDFEDEPGADMKYVGKGSKAGVKAGYFQLAPDASKEGKNNYSFIRPVPGTGCPFIEGTNYKITTKPSWKARLGNVSESTGSDKEGSAKVSFAREGEDYTAVLTLANDLGSDSRTFQFIKVGDFGAIGDIAADGDLRTYTIDDVLYLDVTADGFYKVEIFDVNGRTVASKAHEVAAGDFMQVTINGAPGVYVVNVTRDGQKAKAFKVVKK
ncbi:MAG: T9SS type A sorting domain-containing protein [Bacteroides sp.]|nr:T9SS type A sorting domain-containing protein [Bacteroides sp.]